MPLPAADKLKYTPLYIQTARAYLNDMQRNVTALLAQPEHTDAIDVVHLAAHSLSSQSTMMEYLSMARFSSHVEKLCAAKKEGLYTFTPEVWKLIDAELKHAQESLNEIEKNGNELDLTAETQKLQDAASVK